MGETRARGDSKYGRIYLRRATRTPIGIPTCDLMGEICLEIADTNREWSSFKTDHASASIVDPNEARMCIMGLRSPADRKRFGFLSRPLLFGASGAGLHYNFSPLIVAVSVAKLFGLPAANCFADCGPPFQRRVRSMGRMRSRHFARYRHPASGTPRRIWV